MAAQRGEAIPHMRAWRRVRFMEQPELARAAGVSHSTIQRAERGGTISMPSLRRIAGALGITPTQLVGEEPGAARRETA